MKRLEFESYEDFICEVADKMDDITEIDEFGDIAIIAKYNEANEIVKELIYMGYDIASIHLGKEEFDNYYDEYIITITNVDDGDGEVEIWCEPFKRDNGYITNDSVLTYVMDNCSSACISCCKGTVVFEVGIDDKGNCCDECCKCCNCDEGDNTECTVKSDDDGYTITVRYNLDADEAMKAIKDMENRMERMNDMFREMDYFRRLLRF